MAKKKPSKATDPDMQDTADAAGKVSDPLDTRGEGGFDGPAPRRIPDGMNKYNSSQEWLMLILESLYRIEDKLGA